MSEPEGAGSVDTPCPNCEGGYVVATLCHACDATFHVAPPGGACDVCGSEDTEPIREYCDNCPTGFLADMAILAHCGTGNTTSRRMVREFAALRATIDRLRLDRDKCLEGWKNADENAIDIGSQWQDANVECDRLRGKLDTLNERQRQEWSRAETAEATIDRLREQRDLFRDHVNGIIFACDPECDSHGHTEGCEYLDPVKGVDRLRGERDDARQMAIGRSLAEARLARYEGLPEVTDWIEELDAEWAGTWNSSMISLANVLRALHDIQRGSE